MLCFKDLPFRDDSCETNWTHVGSSCEEFSDKFCSGSNVETLPGLYRAYPSTKEHGSDTHSMYPPSSKAWHIAAAWTLKKVKLLKIFF